MRRASFDRGWTRMLGVAGVVLMGALVARGQTGGAGWTVVRDADWVRVASPRTEIRAPRGAGFAILKLWHRVGGVTGMDLVIESAKRLPLFPFDKYEGPIDKTRMEFMEIAIEPAQGKAKAQRRIVVPNGWKPVDPQGGFIFETIEKQNLSFLLGVQDGQTLSFLINGPPSSIRVVFDATGLKAALGQMGLKQLLDLAVDQNGNTKDTPSKKAK